MIAVVAGNHQEFEDWLAENFVYIGDKYMIESIDPNDIDSFAFIGSFRDHPIYFSDELLDFQFKVAAKNVGLEVWQDENDPNHKIGNKPTLWKRFKRAFREIWPPGPNSWSV